MRGRVPEYPLAVAPAATPAGCVSAPQRLRHLGRAVIAVAMLALLSGCAGGTNTTSPPKAQGASTAVPTSSASQATPSPEVVVTRTALKSFPSSEGLMYELVVEVQNQGAGYARIDEPTNFFTVFGTSGQVLAGRAFVYVFPAVIGPGEYGYLVEGGETYPTGTTVEEIGKVETGITARDAPGPAAAYAVSGVRVSDNYGTAVNGAVKNTTSGDATDGVVGIVLFGATGEILGAVYDNTSIVTIQAGQSRGFEALYPPTPPIAPADVKSWKAYAFDFAIDPAPPTEPRVPIGSCYNEDRDSAGVAKKVVVVSCDKEHELEMIGTGEYPAGPEAAYPDAKVAEEEAAKICRPLFESYVGIDYDRSDLYFWYYVPTSDSWAAGDRLVECAAGNQDGSMLPPGSVRDARR